MINKALRTAAAVFTAAVTIATGTAVTAPAAAAGTTLGQCQVVPNPTPSHHTVCSGDDLGLVTTGGLDLRYAQLDHTTMQASSGIDKWNLQGADLTGAQWSTVEAKQVNFRGATLDGIGLDHSNVAGSDFTGASVRNADLTYVWFAAANYSPAVLVDADLTGSNLAFAEFGTGSSLNDMTGATLTGANFTESSLVPPDVHVPATSASGAAVTWASAQAETGEQPGACQHHDSGDPVSSGAVFPIGARAVDCQVISTANNTYGEGHFVIGVKGTRFATADHATFHMDKQGSFTIRTFTWPRKPAATIGLASGELPVGLKLKTNGDNAVLSGTPDQLGTFPIKLVADNGAVPGATQTLTVTVVGGTSPSFTNGQEATFDYGHVGSFTITANGIPKPTIRLKSGKVPDGLELDIDGNTAQLGGTPKEVGTFALYLVADNGVAPAATQTLTVQVTGVPPNFYSFATASFTAGESGSFTVETEGEPAPTIELVSGKVPPGLELNIDGDTAVLSGTPTDAGTYRLGLHASNGVHPDADQTLTVTVKAPPKTAQSITFTSSAPRDATVGGPAYRPTATATSDLPVSMSIDPSSASVCSIASGTVSFTATGTCVIDANQAGNDAWQPAPQAQQRITVGKGSQSVAFTSPAPDAAVGATYTPTATASSGLPVTMSIAPASAGVCSLNSGTVSFTAAGTCTVLANQGGNDNWNPAPPVQQAITVAKGTQTIAFTSTPPSDATVGATYSPTAKASSGLPVTTSVAPTSAGVCSLNNGTVSFTAKGTCIINADQPGNANWNPAPQAQQKIAVSGRMQTITFTSTPPDAVVAGPTYTPTAKASSGLSVTLSIDPSSADICTMSKGTVSFTAAGTCIIAADQSGNDTWKPAPHAQQKITVGKGNQAITFTSTPPDATVGGPTYAPTAKASSSLPVTLSIDPSASDVCSLDDGTVSFTAAGTCIIDANQAGNDNWNPAPQAQQKVSVTPAPLRAILSSIAGIVSGLLGLLL